MLNVSVALEEGAQMYAAAALKVPVYITSSLSDRFLCNRHMIEALLTPKIFQYPRSDRMLCNCTRAP